jgi:hypothetical protein
VPSALPLLPLPLTLYRRFRMARRARH